MTEIEIAITHYDGNNNEPYADLVVEALRKQIPKKVGGFIGQCKCGKTIYPHMKYCNNCGQALDWSDTE